MVIQLLAIFNARTLNTVNHLPELRSFAVEHNINIICIHENRFYHSKQVLKYYDTGNRWTFVSESALKNFVNDIIGGVGKFLTPRALKSLNSIDSLEY